MSLSLPLMDSPLALTYGILLILLIVYSVAVPVSLRMLMDSLLGRILGVLWIYGITESLGWVYGILTAMAFLLLLYRSPSSPYDSREGFDGGGTVSEKRRIGKRWFVERVLGEQPVAIATDRVTTHPVQE